MLLVHTQTGDPPDRRYPSGTPEIQIITITDNGGWRAHSVHIPSACRPAV